MQSLPICFHYLKAPWFWLDNYNVLSQPAVTKEQELPKWSKMHRRLLLIYHTVMNPDTAFWSMELKDRKRERKKKKRRGKGERKTFEHFVPVSFHEWGKHQAWFNQRMPSHSHAVAGEVATVQIPETHISQSTQTESLLKHELSLMVVHIHSRANKKNGRNGWTNFIQDLTYNVSIMNVT